MTLACVTHCFMTMEVTTPNKTIPAFKKNNAVGKIAVKAMMQSRKYVIKYNMLYLKHNKNILRQEPLVFIK